MSMLSLFGWRKDSKKSTSDKEVDGGFVIVGEAVEAQRGEILKMNTAQPSTNVIVQPSKSCCLTPAQSNNTKLSTVLATTRHTPEPLTVEMATLLPDLLGDIPFTLAPHVLAMQTGLPLIPDVLLFQDITCSLAHFQYDFTLENSVLHGSSFG